MIMDRIGFLLDRCATEDTFFPPTDLYNEGWMLRLVLDWLHCNRSKQLDVCLPYSEDSVWFSEALLPSAFLARERGDRLAESWTHADGVVGHFNIGTDGKGDFTLQRDAKTFVVLEAKIFSKLSPGVTNANYYNQAARNVACMAEVVSRSDVDLDQLSTIAFCVVAPSSQIEAGIFSKLVTRESIVDTVKRRVDAYDGERDDWFRLAFSPVAMRINLLLLPWENVLKDIRRHDAKFGDELEEFYSSCLHFNGLVQSSRQR